MPPIPSLPHVAGVAFDLDGTLYKGDRLLAGAAATVAALRACGVPVRFLTNTTSRSRTAIARRLAAFGIPAAAAEVFSPPVAAGGFLRDEQASAHLLVLPEAHVDFAGVTIDDEQPDYVVVGDLEEAWTGARLDHAFRLLHDHGAHLIGLGRTRYWQTDQGLKLDAGAYVAALEYASGQHALIFGKPDPAFFRAVAADMELLAQDVAVVGDDIVTDVAGAMAAGLCGVLVRTGKFRAADLHRGIEPDLVLASLSGLLVDT